MASETATKPFNIVEIRKQFPVLGRQVNGHPLVYLDNGASSQKPIMVIGSIEQYYRQKHANIHRGVHHLSQEATQAYEDAREKLRGFINAEHNYEVLFTKGTTDSINLVASSFGRRFLEAGDEVIVSVMEHHSNIVPWQIICEQRGARLRVVDISDAGELDMLQYSSMLSDKTRLVALTHISNSLGTINPVEKIIAAAHEKDIPVLLDGAQAVSHIRVDVQALDVDFYAFSGHKMFGPTGAGILYGKQKWLNQMPPYQAGGDMVDRVSFDGTTYNTLPYKFEAGTPNIADSIGLGVAVDFINQYDPQDIAEHENEVLGYAIQQLSNIDSVRFVGTAANKVGVISFLINDVHPFDVGTILDQLGIAVRTGHHCTQPLMDFYGIPGTVRASFALYNDRNDVDQLVAGVKRAAAMLC